MAELHAFGHDAKDFVLTPVRHADGTSILKFKDPRYEPFALLSAAETAQVAATLAPPVPTPSPEPTPTPAPSGQLLGVNVWPIDRGTDAEREHELTLASAYNAKVARISTLWDQVEPGKGQISAASLAHLDAQVMTAAAKGIVPILTLAACPGWANGGQLWTYSPLAPADLGSFALYLLNHYGAKGVVPMFEPWNEPNKGTWPIVPPAGQSPEYAYGQLVKALVAALAGKARTLAGALSYTDASWLATALKAGGVLAKPGGCDVSFHPYADGHAPGDKAQNYNTFQGGIEKMHSAFPEALLHVGEFGYAVSEVVNGVALTQTQRASYLAQSFQIVRAMPYVASATSYELRSKSDGFGLVDASFTPYPALAAVGAAIA